MRENKTIVKYVRGTKPSLASRPAMTRGNSRPNSFNREIVSKETRFENKAHFGMPLKFC